MPGNEPEQRRDFLKKTTIKKCKDDIIKIAKSTPTISLKRERQKQACVRSYVLLLNEERQGNIHTFVHYIHLYTQKKELNLIFFASGLVVRMATLSLEYKP
jgi:hypothetical protein